MPLPDTDSSDTFGGAGLVDYAGQGVTDPTTDRAAAGVNPLVADVAGMTHLNPRAWCQFSTSSTSGGADAPTVNASDACWAGALAGGTPLNAAPVVTRVDVGKFYVTYPTTVYDEIPVGAPGYVGAHTVNLRFSSAPPRFKSSTLYVVVCETSGNVVTVTVTSGGSAVDVASLTVDVLSF